MNQRGSSAKNPSARNMTTSQPYQAPGMAKSGLQSAKRKVEGYDGGHGRPDTQSRLKHSAMNSAMTGTRAGDIGQNFSQNLERLKNQGTKQVEDEYIKTLQEEIKILEYQMKILKDKEIEQQAAVSQIDKFFSDGVPLNDNILALKTQYQSKKSDEQKHIEGLRHQIVNMDKNALDLENEIKQYSFSKEGVEKEKLKVEDDLQKMVDDLKKEIYNEKFIKADMEKRLRELQEDFKRCTDQNLKINRDLEKERVLSTHKNETAATRRYKMERDVEAKDAKIKELNEEIDKLNGASSLNPQLMAVETENNELRRKILNLEKEIGMAQAKIKEAEFLMETRRKERATESQLKRQLQNNIEMKRLQIDEAHRMNELIIEQKVKEKQDSELRQKETEHNKILDRIQNVKRRTGMEEQEIEKICQEKVTIQQDIIEQEQIKEKLEKDLVTAKKKAHELKIQLEFLEDKYKQQTARIEPLKNMEEKQKTIIPSYESEIKNYEDQIAQFDKQIEFAKQVKGLNFNDLKVMNSANGNVNMNIMNFIKRYEDIQRMSKLNTNLN